MRSERTFPIVHFGRHVQPASRLALREVNTFHEERFPHGRQNFLEERSVPTDCPRHARNKYKERELRQRAHWEKSSLSVRGVSQCSESAKLPVVEFRKINQQKHIQVAQLATSIHLCWSSFFNSMSGCVQTTTHGRVQWLRASLSLY